MQLDYYHSLVNKIFHRCYTQHKLISEIQRSSSLTCKSIEGSPTTSINFLLGSFWHNNLKVANVLVKKYTMYMYMCIHMEDIYNRH